MIFDGKYLKKFDGKYKSVYNFKSSFINYICKEEREGLPWHNAIMRGHKG